MTDAAKPADWPTPNHHTIATGTFSYERCNALIDALDRAESEDDVLAAVTEHGITSADFIELDERPGQFGGDYRNRAWHARLRRARNNPRNDLFDRIKANAAGGS